MVPIRPQVVHRHGTGQGSLKERLTECKRAGEDGIPVEELLEYFEGLAEAWIICTGRASSTATSNRKTFCW